MIKSAIADVVAGRDLSEEQARAVMTAIMEEDVTPAQFAALVTALRIKGETVDEVAGFASVMRDKAVPVQADQSTKIWLTISNSDGTRVPLERSFSLCARATSANHTDHKYCG